MRGLSHRRGRCGSLRLAPFCLLAHRWRWIRRNDRHSFSVEGTCLDRRNSGGSLRATNGCYATRRLWGQDYESLN